MKRSYFKATVRLREGMDTITKYTYTGFKKIRYILIPYSFNM